MKIEEYKKTLKLPLLKTTLCFLIKEEQILLAMKKRGFGVSKWNGAGGKLEQGESVKEAVIREVWEELGVKVDRLDLVAKLNFYYPYKDKKDQEVSVYFVKEWEGEPRETEEMLPKWFAKNDLPFSEMWPDDRYWLTQVLDGEKVEAEFIFNEDDEILNHVLNVAKELN